MKGPGQESANQHRLNNKIQEFMNYKSAVYSNNTSLTTAKSQDIVGNSPKSIWSFSITLLTKNKKNDWEMLHSCFLPLVLFTVKAVFAIRLWIFTCGHHAFLTRNSTLIHCFMGAFGRIQGQDQGHEPLKVWIPSIFKTYLLRHLQWQLASDH